eukprot:scaffold68931_cov48-Prasinocladus_malaysianus.AAC.2
MLHRGVRKYISFVFSVVCVSIVHASGICILKSTVDRNGVHVIWPDALEILLTCQNGKACMWFSNHNMSSVVAFTTHGTSHYWQKLLVNDGWTYLQSQHYH